MTLRKMLTKGSDRPIVEDKITQKIIGNERRQDQKTILSERRLSLKQGANTGEMNSQYIKLNGKNIFNKPILTNSKNLISLFAFHRCCLIPFFGNINQEVAKVVYLESDFSDSETIYRSIKKNIDKNYDKKHFYKKFYPKLVVEIQDRELLMKLPPEIY